MANALRKLLSLGLLTLLSTACLPFGKKSNLAFKTHPLPETEEVIPETITYDYLRKHILGPQCISCHEGMGQEAKLISWWIVKGVPEESELFTWMEDGSMPPSRPATTRELEIVRRYIEQLKPAEEAEL